MHLTQQKGVLNSLISFSQIFRADMVKKKKLVLVFRGSYWDFGLSFPICKVVIQLLLFLRVLSCSVVSDSLWPLDCSPPGYMEFSRQESWSGLPFPPPRHLPNWGVKPESLVFPALAGRFFTAGTNAPLLWRGLKKKKVGSTLKGLSSYRSLSIILQQNDKRYFSKNIFWIEQNNPSLFAIKPFIIGKWILGEILAPWWVNWPGLSLSPFSATLRRGRIFKILLRGLKK